MKKVVLVGDENVGKTALCRKACGLDVPWEHIATIGFDFGETFLTVDGKKIQLKFWDTAGKNNLRDHTGCAYKGASIILLMFDLTNPTSFNNLKTWLAECQKTTNTDPFSNTKYLLVGTKADLVERRKVSIEDMNKFVAQNKIKGYFEISTITGVGIDKLLEETARLAIINKENRNIPEISFDEQSHMVPENRDIRELIKNKLQKYVEVIESEQKTVDGKRVTDFAAGLIPIYDESRALSRQANYLLAKKLLEKLADESKTFDSIFNRDMEHMRTNIVMANNLHENEHFVFRGIHGRVKEIITEAQSHLEDAPQPQLCCCIC